MAKYRLKINTEDYYFLLIQYTFKIYRLAYHLNQALGIYLKIHKKKEENLKIYQYIKKERPLWSLTSNEYKVQKSMDGLFRHTNEIIEERNKTIFSNIVKDAFFLKVPKSVP